MTDEEIGFLDLTTEKSDRRLVADGDRWLTR
jgi:hypothetical protein